MAGEVKSIISEFIKTSTSSEISVEDLLENFPQFTRVDTINVLKQLELDGNGALCVGRRGKSTRFMKNAHRIKVSIDEKVMQSLRDEINSMTTNDFISVKDASEKYFSNNLNLTIEALKEIEAEGLGIFLIGRRGAVSRFIVGASREKIVKEPKVRNIPVQVETVPPQIEVKYKLVNGIIINAVGCDDGFDQLEALISAENLSIENLDEVKSGVKTAGYFQL